jgi:protein phosphatase
LSTAILRFTASALSDRGRKRPSNEDAYGFSVEHGVYLVCDGMGGAAAGEIASSLAIDEVLRPLRRRAQLPIEVASMPQVAEQAIRAANGAIYSRAQRNYKLNGMGTTLVAMVVENSHAWILNIGDSRCYRLRNRCLEQLTQDHSLVEEQIRLGRMTRPEALRSPLRNVITRALGTQPSVTPDVFELDTEPGDLFLLCSDGLTREIADAQLELLLASEAPLGELCASLVSAANQAGGHDNITCLLVRAEA